MNVITIITDALQSIPKPVRKGLLTVYALCVVGTGVSRIAGFEGWPNLEDALLYIGGYLGVQSAANVHEIETSRDQLTQDLRALEQPRQGGPTVTFDDSPLPFED